MLKALVGLLIAASVALLACSVLCAVRASGLSSEAALLRERSRAEGDAFIKSLSEADVNKQLATMDERRDLLRAASNWRKGELASLVALLLSAFAAYVFHSLGKIHIEDGAGPSGHAIAKG